MNEQPKSIWRRDILPRFSVFRFCQSLFSRRVLRRIIIVLVWTATLMALLYGEEHWRGRRAWNKFRQELESRGEQLDLKAFIPKTVPDEQNFAATPFIRSWFERTTNSEQQSVFIDPWKDDFAQADKLVLNQKLDENRRHFVDLTAWAAAFDAVHSAKSELSDEKAVFRARYGLKKGEDVPTPPGAHQEFLSMDRDLQTRSQAAPAVLEGLKSSAAPLAELGIASQRPFARYPIIYNLDNPWAILLPHLAHMKGVCRRLELRACAELTTGENAKALDDVKLMLYLADSLKEEPFLISYLVRLSCLQLATRAVWEGLAEQRWSEAQLQELEGRFQQYDLLADVKLPLATEQAAGVLTVDLLARGKYNLSDLGDFGNQQPSGDAGLPGLVCKFVPRGWFYLEQLNYCRFYQLQLDGTFDAGKKRISPERIEANGFELQRELYPHRWAMLLHHRIIAALLLPALNKVNRSTARAQTALDQAAIACGLERCRLANGQFPEKLELLASRFTARLPTDALTGEPYKYRRTEDGQFVLYSIGWDEKDDGGTPGKALFDEKQGDWVWRYPPK